jgi:hypothetical protein
LGGVHSDAGFIGKIAEVLIFKAPLSDVEASGVYRYLATKYQLDLAAVDRAKQAAAAIAWRKAARRKSKRDVSDRGPQRAPSESSDRADDPGSHGCGGLNPFGSVSMEAFVPPENAEAADRERWRKEVKEAQARIRQVTGGGQLLRAFIKREVAAFSRTRDSIFCKYVVGGSKKQASLV